jgi:GTP-binding protein
VVYVEEGVSFVMADIPGIIEGASEGAGLGHDFLRHIDRCRLLVHLVDVSGSEGRDPVADFDAINAELAQYSPDLAKRPQIVCANKSDILDPDRDNLTRLRHHVEAQGYTLLEISAAAHQGTAEWESGGPMALCPAPSRCTSRIVPKPPVIDASAPLDIQARTNGTSVRRSLAPAAHATSTRRLQAGCGSTRPCASRSVPAAGGHGHPGRDTVSITTRIRITAVTRPVGADGADFFIFF